MNIYFCENCGVGYNLENVQKLEQWQLDKGKDETGKVIFGYYSDEDFHGFRCRVCSTYTVHRGSIV